jgi:hypothetical protein
VHADAKEEPIHLSSMCFPVGNGLLKLNRGRHGINGTGELNECAVTSELDQPAASLHQNRLQAFRPNGTQACHRAALVAAH